MDGEFSATKDGLNVVLSCTKAKDFEAFKPQQFSLMSVDLPWLDDGGEPLKSVYLEHTGDAQPATKKRKLSARDDAILTALSEAIDKHGIEPSAEIREKFAGFDKWSSAKVVRVDHWRDRSYKVIVTDKDTVDSKRMAFKRARDKLFNHGATAEYDGYAWRIYE
jgi:hypothetical protein